jgi:hypothetical protein
MIKYLIFSIYFDKINHFVKQTFIFETTFFTLDTHTMKPCVVWSAGRRGRGGARRGGASAVLVVVAGVKKITAGRKVDLQSYSR